MYLKGVTIQMKALDKLIIIINTNKIVVLNYKLQYI